ncbi:PHP domain-containing protein [Photobacterium rosenbergii]|uniref:PHP domain-containing protein n=1 Tax=Photobacterium rosenbergii TaxID=294936 RepID=A0ABU3ZKB0_9GAMM|nr:PHP domain-containing protein [Photobacterium rosenbergii]MDV5170542.1 PHP domain-containing protein [Photobacterium rosenbergii]
MIEFDKLSSFFSGYFQFKPRDKFIYLDFHLHTVAAEGATITPSVVSFLLEQPHLIAVTDHNDIRGAAAMCEIGMNNIPSIELVCEDGFELLVYFNSLQDLEAFYAKEVEKSKHRYRMARTDKGIDYYLDLLQERDCYLSIPHINGLAEKNYLKNMPQMKSVIKRVDAIETYNHALPKNRNVNAQIIRRFYQLEATFGSSAFIRHELLSFCRFLGQEERRHQRLLGSLYQRPSRVGLAQRRAGQ